jgi:hypothetical protein
MVQYTKEQKLEWQRQKIAEAVAKGQMKPTANIKRFVAGKPMLYKSQRPEGSVEKDDGALVATTPSTCFDDLSWEDGVASGTFVKGGQTYDYEMSREEFLEWADDDSLGGYFNDNVR